MNKDIIEELLVDMYGNYVLQKGISSASPEEQFYILSVSSFNKVIAPLMDKLKNYPFGIKLHTKLLITYPQLSTLMMSYYTLNSNYLRDQDRHDSSSSVTSNLSNYSFGVDKLKRFNK